jgi:hypothetical protein
LARSLHPSQQALRLAAAASILAISGLMWVFGTHAGTFNTSAEAEGGVQSGMTFKDNRNSDASGGQAIRFGSALPSQVFDLSNWKLTLPIGSGGSPTEIKQPRLDTYSIDPWFHLNAEGTAIVFHVNHGGVTTSGSSNPRSELREMANNGMSGASWSSTSGTHTMAIEQRVTHLTNVRPHVVVGQIHDAKDDVTVFRLESNKLWITDGNKANAYLVDSNYQLGTRFTVKFEVSGGVVSYYYNDQKLNYTQHKSFSGAYFKAGNYLQSNPSTASGESNSAYSEVEIYDVQVTHKP